MKSRKRILFTVCMLMTAWVLALGAQSAPVKVTHLYTFGDSSIDIGRAKELTTAIVNSPNPPEGAYIKAEDGWYWQGRYSNGRVYTELLAEHLGVDITSYAVGGAKSGPDASGYTNWSSWLPGTGGIEQTAEFVQSRGGRVDSNGLYLISIGGNDTYNLLDDTVENVTAQSAANIGQMVTDLAEAGAVNFIVVLQSYKPGSGSMSAFTAAHRTATVAEMERLIGEYDISILCVDFNPLNRAIEQNPAQYGYKTLSYYMISDYVPAIGYGYHFVDNTALFAAAPAGYGTYAYDGFTGYDRNGFWTPDEYYFYDEYHVTRTTHRNSFDYMKPEVDAFLNQAAAGARYFYRTAA